jgi:hypothetical protein
MLRIRRIQRAASSRTERMHRPDISSRSVRRSTTISAAYRLWRDARRRRIQQCRRNARAPQ